MKCPACNKWAEIALLTTKGGGHFCDHPRVKRWLYHDGQMWFSVLVKGVHRVRKSSPSPASA